MVAILGISAFYHDSAAALVVDGKLVAAASEERFTRIKHDASFPTQAIAYCLAEAGIGESDIDHVGFYEKPLLKFDRLIETYLSYSPLGFRSFLRAIPTWVQQKLHLRREIRDGLNRQYQGRLCFCEHHQSHAASAFFPSPFDEAAILTMDGVGEWTTTSLGIGRGNRVSLSDEIRFPHSLGLLYSAFTFYAGFRVNSGEYKLMGLAPYGNPQYVDLIRTHLIDLKADGSFHLNLDYFNYCQGLTMTSAKFHRLFGRQPRKADTSIDQLDMDLAASIQVVTEDVILRTANHLHEKTGMDNLCMAGGVALNCVANGRLLREGPFKNVWVQPAAGDAGGALGVASLIWFQLLGNDRQPSVPDGQSGSLLGPSYCTDNIAGRLDQLGAVYQEIPDEGQRNRQVAQLLASGKVVGRFAGRMEFGPRALGNRSILGDPRCRDMQSVMNLKIKFRESFRPFAPVVLADHATDYFDIGEGIESPYMLMVCDIAEHRQIEPDGSSGPVSQGESGLSRVNEVRSDLPAITHVDYSARVQTVDQHRNPEFERLLRAFYEQTGCPVLINTSFNVRGEPIVCTPEEAFQCFMATDMDVLVLENLLLIKEDQQAVTRVSTDQYLSKFALD
ncbi:Decarbamoylnovobiocin carbamoyltransferase [Rubripirellula lacrimiformis]|uniref:Decarbamoylnovobiocin carbamoyltransferase n=1 Tax=Rubripirellula lacrimiformis TaxID=1930273 RepID=A0A517N7M7_9BACT|nr:carbamoyltransferase [Rubripirellula lacrimiformis]QDT03149.1 Decarbamoylnovobiocin carbamoyltransferase [Rubripirellula lacrimiformis]